MKIRLEDPIFAKGEIAAEAINCKKELERLLAQMANYGHFDEISRFMTTLKLDWNFVSNILEDAVREAQKQLKTEFPGEGYTSSSQTVQVPALSAPNNHNVA